MTAQNTAARRPLVAGNWKMHKLIGEATGTLADLRSHLAAAGGLPPGEVLICPPFTALAALRRALRPDEPIGLAAQNVHWPEHGPWTGEVSAAMLADAGCRAVLVGHSERRAHFGETDELVAKKAKAVGDTGLLPIVCIGETLDQRRAGRTAAVLRAQTAAVLAECCAGDRIPDMVIAYEPVWAIGTGQAADAAAAIAAAEIIRETMPDELAGRTRVLYGGSVKAANVAEYMAHPAVDGVLVGGASLDAREFAALILAGLGAKV